jgi:hypothetical protein
MTRESEIASGTLILNPVMKIILSLICLFWLAQTKICAQHCPFDGYSAIVIRTGDQKTAASSPYFFLVEKEEKRRDTCRFTSRVDSTRFKTEKEIRAEMAGDPHSTRSRYLPEQLKKDHNFLKGNQTVFLTMSQKDCMVARGNEYDYFPRKFVIHYTDKGREIEIPVPAENIYSLCGTGGSWNRIKPIIIRLDK